MNICEKKHSVRFIFGRCGDLRNTRMAIKAKRLWLKISSIAWFCWKKSVTLSNASIKLSIPSRKIFLPG